MTYSEELAEWYAGVLETYGPFIPDVAGKRRILEEWRTWQAIAVKPRAKRDAQLIAFQWDRMLAMLAEGSKDLAPGWSDEWDDLSS